MTVPTPIASHGGHPAIEIAAALREIAAALELEGDRFRARAYDRAARTVELTPGISEVIAERRLAELPGIGHALAHVIDQLNRTGTTGLLERMRKRWPPVAIQLARLPQIGALRARRLFESLSPRSLEDVEALCLAGRVRAVRGFSRTSEARVLEAIRNLKAPSSVALLARARRMAESIAEHLRACGAVRAVEICGPVRRWIELVDRIALAVLTSNREAVRERLSSHGLVKEVERMRGDRVVVRLACGLPCEVRIAPAKRFGMAMIEATGSSAHVALLREHAAARQVDLDRLEARDEAAVYRAVGLPFLPPEVRGGTDEITNALAGDDFSDLVAVSDIMGAIHCHTVYSDGRNTIEQMALAAEARGFEYLTITDHSPSAAYAGGLTIERLHQQWDEIADVQKRVDVRILRGTESDILEGGGLDYPDDVLADLDIVIASIHQRHRLDEDGMTRRLVKAMRHPVFKVWGHALGRLILKRDPIRCRFDEVLDAIVASRAAIEINGDPRRLDLDPDRARLARERGVRFVLSTDAHSVRDLDYLEFAVGMARRARIRKSEVLNVMPFSAFARAVRPRESRDDLSPIG